VLNPVMHFIVNCNIINNLKRTLSWRGAERRYFFLGHPAK
jgi:hypothetical protein